MIILLIFYRCIFSRGRTPIWSGGGEGYSSEILKLTPKRDQSGRTGVAEAYADPYKRRVSSSFALHSCKRHCVTVDINGMENFVYMNWVNIKNQNTF